MAKKNYFPPKMAMMKISSSLPHGMDAPGARLSSTVCPSLISTTNPAYTAITSGVTTHMRQQVKKSITSQRSDCECNEELQKMVVDDFVHKRNDGDCHESNSADHSTRRDGITP